MKPKLRESYREALDEIADLYRDCGADFILDSTRGIQPMEDMLDSPYHLTVGGRAKRTSQLSEALRDGVVDCPNEPAQDNCDVER